MKSVTSPNHSHPAADKSYSSFLNRTPFPTPYLNDSTNTSHNARTVPAYGYSARAWFGISREYLNDTAVLFAMVQVSMLLREILHTG
jgi:hypothetical protein